MKSILVAAGVALAFVAVGPALAADTAVPVRPAPAAAPVVVVKPYAWSGWYVGVVAGAVEPISGEVVVGGVSEDIGGVHGPTVGANIGWNHQVGPLVWGMEVDGAWTNAKTDTLAPCALLTSCTDTLTSLFTVRGRLGAAAGPEGRVLLYATAGAAWGQIKRFDTLAAANVTQFEVASGVTVGGGIDVALRQAPRVILGVDALWVDLFNAASFTPLGVFPAEQATQQFAVVRGRLAVKF